MKTDYLYALENLVPTKKLRRVILSITSLCNSRCKTCNLWKNKTRIEPSLETLTKLADSDFFKDVRFLVLTGGEPFLRKDIDQVVNMFKSKNPNLHITILTNALMPELTLEKVKKMPRDVLITFSFNGKPEAHDETRGVKGNFKKLLTSIDYLKKINQNINLIFTICKENYDQIIWAWEFAKKHDLNVLFNPEMDYERLNRDEERTLTSEQKNQVMSQLKKIYSNRHRPFFDDTYLLYFKRFFNKTTITNICYAGTNSIFIDCTGDVYPCENLVGVIKPLGNINNNFQMPKDYLKTIKQMKCYEKCFLQCEMVRNLRKHPIKTIIERKR